MVQSLDADGPVSPEASGFETILSGVRSRLPDDDALLNEIGAALDSLHAHYRKEDTP